MLATGLLVIFTFLDESTLRHIVASPLFAISRSDTLKRLSENWMVNALRDKFSLWQLPDTSDQMADLLGVAVVAVPVEEVVAAPMIVVVILAIAVLIDAVTVRMIVTVVVTVQTEVNDVVDRVEAKVQARSELRNDEAPDPRVVLEAKASR